MRKYYFTCAEEPSIELFLLRKSELIHFKLKKRNFNIKSIHEQRTQVVPKISSHRKKKKSSFKTILN